MENTIINSIFYIIPALITGFVAYYMFNGLINHLNADRKLTLLAANKKETLPIKLQAYERMLLFCERINPVKLLLRVPPLDEDSNAYLQLLIANIEQEFEHNMVQQIYISNKTWTAILAAKTAITNKLKEIEETSNNANELRENILITYSKTLPPTETAIAFIKQEVQQIL